MASCKTWPLANEIMYGVKQQEPILVRPAEAIESHPHFLTHFDALMAQSILQVVLVYKGVNGHGARMHDPAMLLKESLQKVLVHYYPIAGRLGICPDQGKLIVECNGEGVLFVEADANIEIAHLGDLNHLVDRGNILGSLVYPIDRAVDRPPLVTTQVTRFKCGGFVLGMVYTHCILDGIASAEFLRAWAETTRGLPISTPSVIDTTCLKPRSPLQVKFHHSEIHVGVEDLSSDLQEDVPVIQCFSFTPERLERLKKKAMEDGVLSTCTTFEALAGFVWRATAVANCMEAEKKMRLHFAVDLRSRLLTPALPKGYVGNGVARGFAEASVQELEEKALSHAVKQVQDGKARMTEEYIRSMIDYIEQESVMGRRPSYSFPRTALTMTSWTRLGYTECDFGWGKPTYTGPVAVSLKSDLAIFFSPHGDQDIITVLVCLSPQAMDKFSRIIVQPHLLD